MGFTPGLSSNADLMRDALAFCSGLKPDVDSGRWHSLQESAKSRPMQPPATPLANRLSRGGGATSFPIAESSVGMRSSTNDPKASEMADNEFEVMSSGQASLR
jgi:hypothetical protein